MNTLACFASYCFSPARLPAKPTSNLPETKCRRVVAAALLAVFSTGASAASNVVISQVYGGGGNAGSVFKNDFIEIYNRSGAAVSLNGWSVQYASATGTSWNATPLPNVMLQPGQYLLVQEAAGTGGTTSLPTPEAVGTIALSGTAGKVVLANTTASVTSATAASVLDLVGFGTTATPFEGAGPTPAPSNSNSVLRGANGCSDTDNNNTDFSAASASPRNGATTFNACGMVGNAPIVAQCPATFSTQFGAGGSTSLAASDSDGIVNGAVISAGAVSGIAVSTTNIAPAAGAAAAFRLDVAAAVALGSYPLTISFSNNQSQTAMCSVVVNVQGAAPTTLTIPQIQGAGASSAYVGTIQSTEGVVTLVVNNGFYMQDPAGDGNTATSDGILVFTGGAPTVSAGDRVRLTATVSEFNAGDMTRTVTELTGISGLTLLSRGNTVAATSISLPLATANDLERYEGMLVRFTSPLTVSQNFFQGRYGQLTLSAGRLEKPTNHYSPRSAQAIAAAAANAANIIVLDDASSLQNPNPIPYIGADKTLRAGDVVSGLTGVIDFGLITASNPGPAGYKLQPTEAPVFSRNNPRSAAPVITAGNVKVASFNVLNFFTTFGDGTTADGQSAQGCSLGTSVTKSNCRGADNLAEFQRQRAKIVAAMLAINADVFGVMEIQNNGDVAAANLVAALNAMAGAGTYAVVPKPVAAGSTGDDAIRVGMIYQPARLMLVGASLSDTDPINNRPPLAQTFRASNGQRFSLIVNHMKSKGSCPSAGNPDADQGDGQGCFNATRIRQAQRLINTFIPQVQAAANDKDVLVIGDLNAYGAEEPIATLTGAGMVNQIERFIRTSALPYSYVFDGESGYIDHALASPSLSAQVAGVTEWHINADEPSVIDYNTEFKPQDLYSATPFRSSDHDPVVISLNLQSATVSIAGNASVSGGGAIVGSGGQIAAASGEVAKMPYRLQDTSVFGQFISRYFKR